MVFNDTRVEGGSGSSSPLVERGVLAPHEASSDDTMKVGGYLVTAAYTTPTDTAMGGQALIFSVSEV